MMKQILASLIAVALLSGAASAQDEEEEIIPEVITLERYDAWMQAISNWGRWGEDDEKGTLNLITPEKRKAAAALVQEGVSISLALDLNKTESPINANPLEHSLQVVQFEGHLAAGDRYSVEYHGYAHSHIDGLPHFTYQGKMYNGVPVEALKETGSERLGIENAYEGIFTRGVLVDMAWHKGVDYLPADTALTARDLEEWEARTGIKLGSGDVLLLRTGRWERMRQEPDANFMEGAAGFHASVATWLRERDVAVIGCDGISDAIPSAVPTKPNALHELVLVGIGMMIFDNLDLDGLAAAARERNRWEFLFVAAPLRVPGGTGSPVNPLAIF